MTERNRAILAPDDRTLVITRVFDAPRIRVWKAWTDPDQMARWLGPRGFSGAVIKMDARPGGAYRFHLRSPDGEDLWAQGVNREIVEPERMVYTWEWADAEGRPSGPETLVTVTFADHDGKTLLTLQQTGFESAASRDGHRGGWNSAFDCLEEYLAAN